MNSIVAEAREIARRKYTLTKVIQVPHLCAKVGKLWCTEYIECMDGKFEMRGCFTRDDESRHRPLGLGQNRVITIDYSRLICNGMVEICPYCKSGPQIIPGHETSVWSIKCTGCEQIVCTGALKGIAFECWCGKRGIVSNNTALAKGSICERQREGTKSGRSVEMPDHKALTAGGERKSLGSVPQKILGLVDRFRLTDGK